MAVPPPLHCAVAAHGVQFGLSQCRCIARIKAPHEGEAGNDASRTQQARGTDEFVDAFIPQHSRGQDHQGRIGDRQRPRLKHPHIDTRPADDDCATPIADAIRLQQG